MQVNYALCKSNKRRENYRTVEVSMAFTHLSLPLKTDTFVFSAQLENVFHCIEELGKSVELAVVKVDHRSTHSVHGARSRRRRQRHVTRSGNARRQIEQRNQKSTACVEVAGAVNSSGDVAADNVLGTTNG